MACSTSVEATMPQFCQMPNSPLRTAKREPVSRVMEENVAKIRKASLANLRDEAWALLAMRRLISDRRVKSELAVRAFELAQLAARLE